MSFTTPAFIRKNTPELRRKLEKLGYTHHSPHTTEDDNKRDFILCFDGNYYLLNKNNWVIRRGHPLKKYGSIDCVTNEQLFLAIAALRDDSDYMQWFTDGVNWVLCTSGNFGVYWATHECAISLDTAHKAVSEELIEHFKTKEQ